MYRGKVNLQLDILEAQRRDGLWRISNIIAAVFNSAGKTYSRDIQPLQIFDQLNGEEPPVEQEDDYDDGGSLSQLKAERAKREAEAAAKEVE